MEAVSSSSGLPGATASVEVGHSEENLSSLIDEMLRMEVANQQALMIIVKEYLTPIREAQPKVLDATEQRTMFNDVEQLLTISIELTKRLQKISSGRALDYIHLIIEKCRDIENFYQPYCDKFTEARKKLEEKLYTSPLFKLCIETCYRESGCVLELESLLLLPLVRVVHLERACMSLHSFAGVAPAPAIERLRLLSTQAQSILRQNDTERMQRATARRSVGRDSDYAERVLVYEGVLQKVCRKTVEPRHMILCADALLYRHRVLRADTLRVNAMAESPLAFQIISEKKSFEVRAETPRKKAAWIAHLHYVIKLSSSVVESGCTAEAPVWVPDEEAENCQICNTSFGVITRRHHCRYCGKVICSKCSPNTIHLAAHKNRCRVCQPCYRQLQLLHSGDALADSSSSSGSGKRLTLSTSNSAVPLMSGGSPGASAGEESPPTGSPLTRRPSLRHYSSQIEDRVGEARELYRAVRQARLSRHALLLRVQLAGVRVSTDLPALCRFSPPEVSLNARTTANTEPGELQRYLCIHTNYRELLQVRNCSGKALTFTWKILESQKLDTLEFSVQPRSGKLHDGETKEFAIDVRASRSGSLNTLLLLLLEESNGTSTEMIVHLKADFDVVGDIFLRFMLNEQLKEQDIEMLQRFATRLPIAAKHFQDKLHLHLQDRQFTRKESASTLVVTAAAQRRKSSGGEAADSSKGLLASKYFCDFQRQSEIDTFQMVKDTVVLRNGTPKQLRLSLECAPLKGEYFIDFAPSQFTLEPGQTLKVLVHAVILHPMTIEKIFKMTVSDHESWLFAVRLTARAWTTPAIELDSADTQGGDIVGSGATGVVVKKELRGRIVAVKRFQISEADPELVSEFYREAKLLSMLRHPNICHLIGVCSKFPHLAVVMEYAPYGSLHSVLGKVAEIPVIDMRLKLKIAMDSARGCHYLHANQIIHRDLKSPNILIMSLDSSDTAVTALVSDFNTSRVAARKGSTLTPNIGTLQWSAPEVLRGDENTTKSDVFSFGIILFEILTRGPPYPNSKFSYAIMDKVLQGMRPEIPPDCPPLYVKLMTDCWAEKPADRPSFADVLWILSELRRTLVSPSPPPIPASSSSSGVPSPSLTIPLLPDGGEEMPSSPPSRNPLLREK